MDLLIDSETMGRMPKITERRQVEAKGDKYGNEIGYNGKYNHIEEGLCANSPNG